MTKRNPQVGTFILDTGIGETRRETTYPNYVYLHPNGSDQTIVPIGQPGTKKVSRDGVEIIRHGILSVLYPWQPIGTQARDCGVPFRRSLLR